MKRNTQVRLESLKYDMERHTKAWAQGAKSGASLSDMAAKVKGWLRDIDILSNDDDVYNSELIDAKSLLEKAYDNRHIRNVVSECASDAYVKICSAEKIANGELTDIKLAQKALSQSSPELSGVDPRTVAIIRRATSTLKALIKEEYVEPSRYVRIATDLYNCGLDYNHPARDYLDSAVSAISSSRSTKSYHLRNAVSELDRVLNLVGGDYSRLVKEKHDLYKNIVEELEEASSLLNRANLDGLSSVVRGIKASLHNAYRYAAQVNDITLTRKIREAEDWVSRLRSGLRTGTIAVKNVEFDVFDGLEIALSKIAELRVMAKNQSELYQ